MTPEPERRNDDLRERLAVTETRTAALEAETARQRERLHSVEGALAGLGYIGRQLEALTQALEDQAGELKTLARRALERPSSASVSATAAWASFVVAATALVLTLTHR